MRKISVARWGKDDVGALSHGTDVTTLAMKLSDEIHGLAATVHTAMIDRLGEMADAVSLEIMRARSERERGEHPQWLMNIRVMIAELEAGLVMGLHAGYISRARLRILMAMVGTVKQWCFLPGGGAEMRFGSLPS